MTYQCIFIQNVLLAVMLFLNSISVQAEQIRIVTEDFAPFQYTESRQVMGMATEVVRAVMSQTRVKGTIRVYPWARAYDMALDEKDILIYSIARTKERESLFKWVGPIAPYKVYLFKLKARTDIIVNTLEDVKKYRIGGAYQDVKQLYLVSQGIKTIDLVPDGNLNIQKLFMGRVDLIPYDELGFVYKVRHLGLDISKIEKAYFLQGISSGLYMAFSKQTSDTIVEQFRQSLLKIKADGRHAKIIEKYIPARKTGVD